MPDRSDSTKWIDIYLAVDVVVVVVVVITITITIITTSLIFRYIQPYHLIVVKC